MFMNFRLGRSASAMTKIVKAHLSAQKRQITKMAKTAASLVTASLELLTDVRAEVVEVESVKKDILQCQADIGGSIVRMEGLDRWIQREIEADPVTAADNALVASYTATLKEFANTEKHYETLIKKMKYVSKELTKIIEQQDQWEAMPPTRGFSLELIDSSWKVSDEEDSVFEADVKAKIKQNSDIRKTLDFTKREVARQTKKMSQESEKLRAGVEECQARLAKLGSEMRVESKVKGVSRKESTVKDTMENYSDSGSEKSRKERMKAAKEPVIRDQESTESDCSISDESDYPSARMHGFDYEMEEEGEKYSNYKGQERYLRLKLSDLPKFDGKDPSEYEEFKTMFMEGYDKNPDLSEVMKLIQLKSSLSGMAKEMLAGVQLINRNYKLAWKILDQNYLKNVRPMEELQKKFIRSTIHKTDYKEMKKDMSKITAIVYDMQNRGSDVDMPYIYLDVIAKFPPAIAEELLIKTLSSRFNGEFSKIQKWVDKILSAKISVEETRASKKVKQQEIDLVEDIDLINDVDYLENVDEVDYLKDVEESEEGSDIEGDGTSEDESH